VHMPDKSTEEYGRLSVEEVLKGLGTEKDKGLSGAEVQKRLAEYGYNEIPEREESTLHRVFRRLLGPIPGMIEAAALLSALARKWDDFVIITILLFTNIFVDFWQESKALNVLKVLKEKLAKKALVFREGLFQTIDARELVTGDIIKIKIGDLVPADAKLIDGDFIQADQSALTGESLPVSKKAGDIAYSNSIVKQGEMLAVVINTAFKTFFGKTVALVAQAQKEEKSHFQRAVVHIGNYLIVITIFLAAVILITALFRHENLPEILRFTLVLTVAAIPVALPAVLSVMMAVGALDLARKQAIVSRLVSIEELAGVDILCSDKTGTLTENRMTISDPVVFAGHTVRELMLYAALASREENRDPIEAPIFEEIKKPGYADDLKLYQQIKFTPFDPVRKRTEAIVQSAGGAFTVAKGAPQVILELCGEQINRREILEKVVDLAGKGFRTLGIGRKLPENKNFEYIGLIPLFDPPRGDSKATIREAAGLGLKVKMLTGDNIAIAKYIADILDIGKNIADARGIKTGARDSEIIGLIEDADGFAQVFPEDKYLIVESLQKANHIVGMTGDGVNDAPALKKADAGIAVSGSTDAARAAADLVLLAPGLSVIVDAVKGARVIFERMKSYSTFRIAETIRVILFMTASIVIFNFYPVTAVMIILLAFLNDLPIMTIAYDNTKVDVKPVKWDMREVLTLATVLGITGVISSFGIFFIAEKYMHLTRPVVQSFIFLKLVVAGHSTIYVTRAEKRFWQKPHPAWRLLWATSVTELVGTLFAVYGVFLTPIGWKNALLVWGYALLWFVINDSVKIWIRRRLIKRE
jgi:H+-transporting ATPase